jgi:hypothetical protein
MYKEIKRLENNARYLDGSQSVRGPDIFRKTNWFEFGFTSLRNISLMVGLSNKFFFYHLSKEDLILDYGRK